MRLALTAMAAFGSPRDEQRRFISRWCSSEKARGSGVMLCPHALQRSQRRLPKLSTWARWTSRQASFLGSLCHMSRSRLANSYRLLTRHLHNSIMGSPGFVSPPGAGVPASLASPFATAALPAPHSAGPSCLYRADYDGHGAGPDPGGDVSGPAVARATTQGFISVKGARQAARLARPALCHQEASKSLGLQRPGYVHKNYGRLCTG